MAKQRDSEFRLYGFIRDRLKDCGWNTKSPANGGNVYTQNEVNSNKNLKEALGLGRPEYVVDIGEGEFWAIEAKRDVANMAEAIKEAKTRAKKINDVKSISCKIVTGVVGNPDTTFYIQTECLVGEKWKKLSINNRLSTGFISPNQVREIIGNKTGELSNYEIDDKLFLQKMQEINKILHDGAINKKNRAKVLACLLLALAKDQLMKLSEDPATLIGDINTRAKSELKKHKKESFYGQIEIKLPSEENEEGENVDIKNKRALIKSIEILKGLNIASAINSGRDVLGQCYEQFLKYGNDAKEIGIVLTPRHITKFGADVVNIGRNDLVFDPTCGTGGFLVAALDKVRKDVGSIENFKKGNLFGVEQDAPVATLAIVNMVFRGDGNSNIVCSDFLQQKIPTRKYDKVLMNPPFALETEYEWRFVEKSLECMERGGLLFAILPTTVMTATDDSREEITWRREMLKRHTLISVIKMPEELFYPIVSKGTYGIIIKAHCAHKTNNDVLWAILHDGITRTKTQQKKETNIEEIKQAVSNFINGRRPEEIKNTLECIPIDEGDDLSPEKHLKSYPEYNMPDVKTIIKSSESAHKKIAEKKSRKIKKLIKNSSDFVLIDFLSNYERGKSGRRKELSDGDLPLISTSEKENGIMAYVSRQESKKIYPAGSFTVSANGGSCWAWYHLYEFAANGDIFVCNVKDEYSNNKGFTQFLCAAINDESWRFNYYRKLTKDKFKAMKVKMPISENGDIDMKMILKEVNSII